MDYVTLSHIYKYFGGFCASNDVSFGVAPGSLAALLGPSGSGKTTLLRMLAGLETPDRGDIFIDGRRMNEVEASQRGIGFVFQSYALFRYMTVFENIAFGLEVQKRPRAEIRARVTELLSLIGLSDLGARYPNQLSGGQRQRVAFARALAPRPRLLLLDEPFAAIDAKLRRALRSWLREMILQVGVTSIFVTHDQEEAMEVADRIIVTNHGRVEQVGTARALFDAPETAFVAQFLGQSQTLPDLAVLRGYAAYPGPGLLRPAAVRLCPAEVSPSDAEPSQPGVVLRASFRGNSTELAVALTGTDVVLETVRPSELPPLSPGEAVRVSVREALSFRESVPVRVTPVGASAEI